MIPRSFRTLSVLLLLFSVLLLGSVKEVVAQKKEHVGRHSPAYMRSVLYLFNNIGHNHFTIFCLGRSKEKQALFGGFDVGQVHNRHANLDLYDYRGLVKKRPRIEKYAEIKDATGWDIVVIAIEGIDVSHYKALTPELYPFEKESPEIKILHYTGGLHKKAMKLVALTCKGLPPNERLLELNMAPIDCGHGDRVIIGVIPKPAFNPDTGNLYGMASDLFVSTATPKFIEWVKEEGLSVSPTASLTTSWGAIKSGHLR